MQNLPTKSLISLGFKALIPVLILSIGAYSLINFIPGNKKTTQPKDIAINVSEVKPVTSMRNIDLGSVLGLSDTPGFIDFCDVAHDAYTVPLATVPSGNLIRNTTYPSMTKCFTSSWGTPPNYSKGCNIDTKECKGWAWRYVCDVNPNVAWAVDEDPNMSDADKMIYFNRHCTKLTGSQSDIGVKFSRMDTPSSSSQVYKLDDVGCGKLVQVDVTTSNCEPNTGQTCGHIDDFLIYYTGICSTPTPTPTPSFTPSPSPSITPTPTPSVTPSPTPSITPTPTITPTVSPTPTPTPTPTQSATIACKSLTGVAKDTNNTEYQLNNLPQNFNGTAILTCVGEATVLPITKMEITLSKTLNSNTVDQVVTLSGSQIQSTTSPFCTSGSLCFKGEATFNINGQGSYTARSQVCNSENLCLP